MSVSSAGIINFIYNEAIVSRALPSSSVDYNWFTGFNVWKLFSWSFLMIFGSVNKYIFLEK